MEDQSGLVKLQFRIIEFNVNISYHIHIDIGSNATMLNWSFYVTSHSYNKLKCLYRYFLLLSDIERLMWLNIFYIISALIGVLTCMSFTFVIMTVRNTEIIVQFKPRNTVLWWLDYWLTTNYNACKIKQDNYLKQKCKMQLI